jgi:hypothetical protein
VKRTILQIVLSCPFKKRKKSKNLLPYIYGVPVLAYNTCSLLVHDSLFVGYINKENVTKKYFFKIIIVFLPIFYLLPRYYSTVLNQIFIFFSGRLYLF